MNVENGLAAPLVAIDHIAEPVFDESPRSCDLVCAQEEASEQSVIHLSDPDVVPLEYIRTSMLGFSFVDKPQDTLMIGLGGGAFVRLVRRFLPEVHVDAVEIDPVVVDIAWGKNWLEGKYSA